MKTEIERVTFEVAEVVDTFLPGLEGACLGTCAMLAVVLRRAGVSTDAVHGSYDGQAHWWLEGRGYRMDPTRRQFDNGSIVEPVTESQGLYVTELRTSARWTDEQAVLEFARMFVYRDMGMRNGRAVLSRLLGERGSM